jgi:hypothetical protein
MRDDISFFFLVTDMATPLPVNWKECLYDEYLFLADSESMPLVDIVNRVVAIVDDDPEEPISDVTQSSLWAVCMLYLHYIQGGNVLSSEEVKYAKYRGGIIGMKINGDEVTMISFKSFLCQRDLNFVSFLQGKQFARGA